MLARYSPSLCALATDTPARVPFSHRVMHAGSTLAARPMAFALCPAACAATRRGFNAASTSALAGEFSAALAVFVAPVSYTHLTLPTNREV